MTRGTCLRRDRYSALYIKRVRPFGRPTLPCIMQKVDGIIYLDIRNKPDGEKPYPSLTLKEEKDDKRDSDREPSRRR